MTKLSLQVKYYPYMYIFPMYVFVSIHTYISYYDYLCMSMTISLRVCLSVSGRRRPSVGLCSPLSHFPPPW